MGDEILAAKDLLKITPDEVLKAVEGKHRKERDVFVELLADVHEDEMWDEMKDLPLDEQLERFNKLKSKHGDLDFTDTADQEERMAILEMAAIYKHAVRHNAIQEKKSATPTPDDVTVSLMADLQVQQDEELKQLMEKLANCPPDQQKALYEKEYEELKSQKLSAICHIVFKHDEGVSEDQLVNALDMKYDAVLDKLALDALQKQMSDADWAKMSERERQAAALKLRLEQKKLMQEGRMDEAAALLGKGFAAEKDLANLLGENKQKQKEMLQKRLEEKRRRLKEQGVPEDEVDKLIEKEKETIEKLDDEQKDVVSLLANLQGNYEDEKEKLLGRLNDTQSNYMSERERQAELARLRLEQLRAKKEGKFGTAAMLLEGADKDQKDAQSRLSQERSRQENLARERLEMLKKKKAGSQSEPPPDICTSTDIDVQRKALLKLVEDSHAKEREHLASLLSSDHNLENAQVLTHTDREARLQELSVELTKSVQEQQKEDYSKVLNEMAALKIVSRQHALEVKEQKPVPKDDVIVSILADLQEVQGRENENLLKEWSDKEVKDLIDMQEQLASSIKSDSFKSMGVVLSLPDPVVGDEANILEDALKEKYDVLKDKMILSALEQDAGAAAWQ